jgi:hypothetical protein
MARYWLRAFSSFERTIVSTAIIIEEAEDRAVIAGSTDLAQDLLVQAARLRRLARATGDAIIHDELVELAAKCDATAAAVIGHWRGHRDHLTSQLQPSTAANFR